MGATYTRQSDYADGDTINAADTNDEFDQLLAAFTASSGHTHDGTAGEGGPVTKLLGNTLTFGAATAGTDITITFDGETNDGVFKWMEDEDYFEFSDDILIASTEKLQFRDTAIYINSSTNGQLDIVADVEVQIVAPAVDINGAVDVSGAIVAASLDISGNIDVDGITNLDVVDIDGAVNIAADLTIASTNKILFNDASQFIHGSSATVLSIAATDEIDLTATAIDINGTVDLSSTLATGGLYTAGAGITSTAAANTLGATSFSDADITNVGGIALDTITNDGTDITLDSSGDIILDAGGNNVTVKSGGTSIFDVVNGSGDVDLIVKTADKNLAIKGTDGASAITALDIDMALNGKATFSGDVVVTGDLTISGDDLVMGTNTDSMLLIADGTNFNPTAVSSLTEISTAANDDVFLAIDTSGGGLKKITRSTVLAGTGSSDDLANVVEDTSPQLGGNLDMNGADIVTVSNATLDLAPNGTGTVVVRGNTNSGAIVFNCESNSHGQKVFAQPHSASVTNTLMLPAGANSTLVSLVSTDTLTNKTLTSPKINENVAVTSTASELNVLDGITAVVGELNALDIGSTAVGTAVASKAVILDSNKDYTGIRNFTISGNLSVAGTTTTVDTVTMEAENAVIFEGATADAHETTLTIVDPTADRTINLPNQSGTVPVLAAASNTAVTSTPEELNALDGITAVVGELNALDIGSTAVGTAVASKAVILDSNKDYTGVRNLTITGELDAATLDISGAVDIASTLAVTGIATFTDDIIIGDGKTIGSASDVDAMTIASNGQITLTQTLIGTALDISGDIDVDGTTNLDVVDIDGAVNMATTALVTGVLTSNGGAVFNEGSADVDFRVESNGNANMVFVDGGNDKVAIGTATATATLTVAGSAVAKTDTDTSNTGNVTLDYTANQNFVLTLTGNTTLVNPSTENIGQSGFISFIQDGTGSRVLSVGNQYFCAGGEVIVLSTAASSIDIVPYVVIAAGKVCLGAPQLAFADAS